ncbi:BCCT family transporter [Rhodobacter sphaeroides]|jgi:BCCT family betaine/carnitine transporter|uniref:Choline/carnitine/betaine transporter, BCCT family n=2 Tax=Cereibacter sphaeroides TaxID=1063 RepID=Q3IXN8_CERS4|nr:BCCT family transporter [Cereibacter sphaeroides]ABN78887.1 choline/carnitine/betaine transporter [Cereibacter sphaeroides ATCC 17029]EKX59720.1 High-affinity choline uptake protein BetT [Rhodobacter sp. AKP1]ABA80696.1 Choline/carnitine/betaine transporter, BCCT family [Cereibacter sphaeroides 2.4.1]ACM03116.1 Choline/carnitine/betaine transporter [Cereibacter sphaeroides KD131]AMJ49023.1 BCCT transporter [Cereibacter sphaeroides]
MADATIRTEPLPEEAIPAPEGPTQIIDTDYEIGQDNISYRRRFVFELDIHNVVFSVSALTIVAFTFLTLMFQTTLGPVFAAVRDALTSNLAWFFLLAGNVFVLLCVVLIFLPLGRIRLGGPDATPDYSRLSWFSMLFAAGMGIGLMFYGVSEPLGNYTAAFTGPVFENGVRTDWSPLNGAPGDTEAARRLAMAATIFHWALHPWAIYAVVALSLALFAYNKGLPLTLRSVFYPIFGERVWGWPGHVIDILAVFATIFGLSTSLGIGAQQAGAGLDFLFGLPSTVGVTVFLVIVITGIATASVIAGMDKGVKRLSEANMALAFLLLMFVILVGPTLQIVRGFFLNLLAYVEYLPALSNPFGRTDDNFRHGWTAFYWAWWISWSPFVGMFIARVSRGRSVREFLIAVLLIPSIVSTIWMTALGGTAISQVVNEGLSSVQDAALEIQLFEMLSHLPLTQITSMIGIVLVIVFFVTSSDSGSLVIDTIAAGGKVNAPVPQRVFWATFEGLVAIALLLGGGLAALQAMAVSTGFPFTIVLLGACYALIRGLAAEPR